MLDLTGHTFGNGNDVRRYPFMDSASLISTTGERMPDSVINDCHIAWPDSLTGDAFISTVAISRVSISVVVAVDETAIASVVIPRPEKPYRSYDFTALVDGVGGWIAVGALPAEFSVANLQTTVTWHFSATAAPLLPRVAMNYPEPPVVSIGKADATALSGIVRVTSGTDITIEEDWRYINGVLTRCAVFGLDALRLQDLYGRYSDPCGRPEANTCDNPTICQLGNAVPDCHGLVYLTINGPLLTGYPDRTSLMDSADGIALITLIETADLCPVVTTEDFIDVYDSLDTSSLIPDPVSYPDTFLADFTSISALPLDDFVLFELTNTSGVSYCNDWCVNDSQPISWCDDGLVLITLPESGGVRKMCLGSQRIAALASVDGSATVGLQYTFFPTALPDNTTDSKHCVSVGLGNEYVYSGPISYPNQDNENCVRAVVSYSRIAAALYANLIIEYWENTYESWSEVASSSLSVSATTSATGVLTLTAVRVVAGLLRSGDNVYDCAASYTHDGGAAVTVSGELAVSEKTYELPYARGGVLAEGAQASVSASFILDTLYVVTPENGLVPTACDDDDFVLKNIGGRQYYAKYTTDGYGYVNDFSSVRGFRQTGLYGHHAYPSISDETGQITLPEYKLPMASGDVVLLQCADEVADVLTVSAAFRSLSGDAWAGIAIGAQSHLKNSILWAVLLNMTVPQICYASHYAPGIVSMADVTTLDLAVFDAATWASNWHRLAVRVASISGNKYQVQTWVDPSSLCTYADEEDGTCIIKMLSISDVTPTFAVSGKVLWSPTSEHPPLPQQFRDGGVGLYCAGGSIEAADFTVTGPTGDIVVPDKVQWLSV